jgi:glycosyltransferase involved in cell wall biosynthesis
MSHKLISFIIPHKGRENFLIETIKSIIDQDFDLELLNIVLITQNKNLSEDISSFKEHIDLEIYYQDESLTISQLRNYGVQKTETPYLAFLDADIYLSNNWCQCMLDTLKNDDSNVLVSAAQIPDTSATPLELIRVALSNAALDEDVDFLPGRNLFLSRDIFDQVGGFPEHLITCEDYYFTDKVHAYGSLFYTSKASYIHLGEDKIYTEMYKKEIWRGQSNLQSIQGRKIPFRELPSFILPLAIVSFMALALLLLLLNQPIPSSILFIMAAGPFLAYSIRVYLLAKKEIKFRYILLFYLYYFPARAIGTIGGLFNNFKSNSHN